MELVELKINKHVPVLLDCYQGSKLIGTVSNSIELFDFRLQIIKNQLDNCSIKVSKYNTNFDYIEVDERDMVISINKSGEVDKWFTECYLDDDIVSVYSETLTLAMKLRKLQKYGKWK